MAVLLEDELIGITEKKFFVIAEYKIKQFPERRHFKIMNKKQQFLGWINYFPRWHRYVFTTPPVETTYDVQCLSDIVDFMKELEVN